MDHSSIGEKVVGFAHCEDWQVAHSSQYSHLATAFVAAEEKDVAALYILVLIEYADMQHSRPDWLSLNRALQLLALWLVVEDAQIDGLI